MDTEMISFGGGVNSVAMTILLVNEGWRGPIVFADTGGEHPETYCYLTYFSKWVAERGMEITRISPETHPQLYQHDKRLSDNHTLEAFCLMRGILPLTFVRWCSVMWKREPIEALKAQSGITVTLLGICADEPQRIHLDDISYAYPLADRGITRGGCQRIIQAEGLEVPPRSACFFCPNARIAEFRRLFHDNPDLYERAASLEDNASVRNGKWATLKEGYSLRELASRRFEGQSEMDLSEWLPCVCTL
jgi:hypothetical protein